MNPRPPLLDILRAELDATNHQFTHILVLQHRGQETEAARITEIDNIDFVNAMRIVDHLVAGGSPFTLDEPVFAPGADLPAILQAEKASEKRLLTALERAVELDGEARALAETARAPRADYAQWLQRQSAVAGGTTMATTTPASMQTLVACLVTLVEQTLIHACVEWRGERPAAADAAWISSGAAMMHLTRLVRLFAKQSAVPSAGACPAADLRHRPGDTLAADRALARKCAEASRRAAGDCEHPAITRYCGQIANSCEAFALWDGCQPHPDLGTTPAVFHSYQATLRKFAL